MVPELVWLLSLTHMWMQDQEHSIHVVFIINTQETFLSSGCSIMENLLIQLKEARKTLPL